MKVVHVMAQGKGGVGKSFSAAILAQYLKETANDELHCFDTDPVNATFSRFKELAPALVPILNDANNIDSRNFDSLIENLLEQDGIGVIDNGAATFVPLMSYMAENCVPELLAENNVRLIVHVPLNGGQALPDCLTGLTKILTGIRAEVVVWLNDHNGVIQLNGKSFTEFKVYKDNQEKILGIVHIANRNPDTYGKDIERMAKLNLTFQEVDASPEFSLMPRQRLRTFKRDLFEQLDKIPLSEAERVDAEN